MKQIKTIMVLLLVTIAANTFGQAATEKLIGKWKTEDNAIVEFYKASNVLIVKQLSAEKEEDKKYNGKQISKAVVPTSSNEFQSIVIDPSDDKEYKGTWILAADGKSLVLKVKWGLINISEKWSKQ